MPAESKPIFRPDVIRFPIARFALPEGVDRWREMLARWADWIGTGAVDAHKEQEILGDFLNDVFGGLLGYSRAVDDPKRYTISREKHVQANGKFADAVLGEFGAERPRYVAVVEGKGPKDPLDRPFAGRKISAVDQAYDYAINLRCSWIITTSMRQTRLYYKGADKLTFERFDTEALATDEKQFRKFVFLLHADRVVPRSGPCHLDKLLQDSEKVGRELTREFYAEYAFIRRSTFARLRADNPDMEPRRVLACAQKLLDRVLFVAFCEDRGLLPPETIARAFTHRDPYTPRPLWDNFRGLFRAINEGRAELNIPRYNGGLFADDPTLDNLTIPDEVFRWFQDLAEYDFRPASDLASEDAPPETRFIDVEILGHIFEQSIDDLEQLRQEMDKPAPEISTTPVGVGSGKVSRRKREGAFYTPDFITRYIVGEALGGALRDRFEGLRQAHAARATGTARAVIGEPSAYDLDALNGPQREALLAFWLDWQDTLATVRIVDPACGSGAFLIEAFDQLHAEYQRTNERVRELRGYAELFDLDRTILQQNLYGVDLNEEAVHIARLSLWIKTALPGKILTSLDHNLRVGNSVVADPSIDPAAFDWRGAFPEVFGDDGSGGFDVVIGNPPYIRQEWLSPIKPYLKERYRAFHGMADLYVYFYELGLDLLRPGGRLSYVVTNKWMKAGYGEPLRGLFAERAWLESVVDFGHAKQIFEDADVFPCIIVARRPDSGPPPEAVRGCAIPREQLRIDDLGVQISQEGFGIRRERLNRDAWNLESDAVVGLIEKLRRYGASLSEYAGIKPYRGILTGLNEAFLIDTPTKDAIVTADPNSAGLIRPYLRGQDIERWHPEWAGLWMIALKSSGDHPWPWAEAGSDAERVFREAYPGLHCHLKRFEAGLIKRQDRGRYWWELRACAYWDEFERPKIFYQEIQFHPRYTMDLTGSLGNNKTFFLACDDLYLLGLLNSPLIWWHNWRFLPHMKDEALSPVAFLIERLPIATPDGDNRRQVEDSVRRLIEITQLSQTTTRTLLDWLRVEHDISEPSTKLRSALELDNEAFVTEVRKVRGKKKPLSLAALRSLRDEHERTIVPAQALASEALSLERRISDLVNDVYGLTPDEIDLIWQTAPPRMPIPRP